MLAATDLHKAARVRERRFLSALSQDQLICTLDQAPPGAVPRIARAVKDDRGILNETEGCAALPQAFGGANSRYHSLPKAATGEERASAGFCFRHSVAQLCAFNFDEDELLIAATMIVTKLQV